MAGRLVDVTERVAHWKMAFDAIRGEITPPEMRAVLAAMTEVEGVSQLASYMQLATAVMANDRTAMTVAAMLVGTGIRPGAPEDA